MNNQTNSQSVLAALRALVPQRPLSHAESLRIAELQANRLLELSRIAGPLVPTELVSDVPKIRIAFDNDLPISGSAHWESGQWILTLNGTEPASRQRFSLMHEFKHVLDHTTKQFLYGETTSDQEAARRAERAADHFAACVLMPKRWLKSLWFNSGQNINAVAGQLEVSPRALAVRLWHLGLGVETKRCAPTKDLEARRTINAPRTTGVAA
jgi:Zn-dependent peptidase ImmA (M78 family)